MPTARARLPPVPSGKNPSPRKPPTARARPPPAPSGKNPSPRKPPTARARPPPAPSGKNPSPRKPPTARARPPPVPSGKNPSPQKRHRQVREAAAPEPAPESPQDRRPATPRAHRNPALLTSYRSYCDLPGDGDDEHIVIQRPSDDQIRSYPEHGPAARPNGDAHHHLRARRSDPAHEITHGLRRSATPQQGVHDDTSPPCSGVSRTRNPRNL